VVFNDGLRLRRQARENGEKYIPDTELSRRLITEARLTPERAWLGEIATPKFLRRAARKLKRLQQALSRTRRRITRKWRSTYERGTALAEQPTTGTSTPPATSRPPDRRLQRPGSAGSAP
jgi:hypothetical protein